MDDLRTGNGIEALLALGASHRDFGEALVTRREEALQASGIPISPTERSVLRAVDPEALRAMMARVELPAGSRRRFLKHAAVAFGALAAAAGGCGKKTTDSGGSTSAGAMASSKSSPLNCRGEAMTWPYDDRMSALGTGIRPDRPPPKPPKPLVQVTVEGFDGGSAWVEQTAAPYIRRKSRDLAYAFKQRRLAKASSPCQLKLTVEARTDGRVSLVSLHTTIAKEEATELSIGFDRGMLPWKIEPPPRSRQEFSFTIKVR